ncbi:GNAT family N-acetyltransferase [Dactylococcopsis salina]|uniref:Acetyltransferase, N-acetylglutamate synthase n=1 Tax=Dactylococcopsis salina (strain PCC 8305) TaxID=13035 RepID=K9YXN8_DACS8|nr:GNAT family N-acetyltransferase [Dactylococcopsis salina]AFZ51262.1 acetyltransferase, N-acetylglutamate synthase [Dactylococcopsis salina PCC 8305]
MKEIYNDFLIRSWEKRDQAVVREIIDQILTEYGLTFDPKDADQDVVEVEQFYQETGGEFWVVEQEEKIVGTAGYYPISRGNKAVEIRKMYLLPIVRGQGLGTYLLRELERAIAAQGYEEIWLETATVLQEAVRLYENNGYQIATGVETARCDRVYWKKLNYFNDYHRD